MIHSSNTITDLPTWNHEALAGFFRPSFEGGNKSGAASAGSLNFQGLDRLT
jgi:hypothetical protein